MVGDVGQIFVVKGIEHDEDGFGSVEKLSQRQKDASWLLGIR